MNYQIQSKLPHIGTTIFTTMSRMAAECGAINLSQGYPDYDGPLALRERAAHYIMNGYNQYAPMQGVLELRQEIANKIAKLYACQVDPETEVTVVPGATEAIFSAITAAIGPGDEVIIFDPAYDSYEPSITLAGGRAVRIPLQLPDFSIDWQRVANSINAYTRMIIINSPHNPSGSVLTTEDMRHLELLVQDRRMLILSDEVYEHLIYDGRQHQSILRYPALAKRAFVVFSFGKTYHLTGWKTGYCVAPPNLTSEFRKVHQFNTFVAVTPLQYALADYMRENPQHYLQLTSFYQQKRDLFADALEGSRFKLVPSAGTYFQLANYSEISDDSDITFVEYLTRKVGVAAIPLSPFCAVPLDAKLVRFCFCKEQNTLLEASDKLSRI